MKHHNHRENLQNQAIQAAQAAIAAHYDTARAELSTAGLFGKELDRKARKRRICSHEHSRIFRTVRPALLCARYHPVFCPQHLND